MIEIRCVKCNKLLMKAKKPVEAEVKCPKCHFINKICTIFGMFPVVQERKTFKREGKSKSKDYTICGLIANN